MLNAATCVDVHISCQKHKFLSCFAQAFVLTESSKVRLTSELLSKSTNVDMFSNIVVQATCNEWNGYTYTTLHYETRIMVSLCRLKTVG